jgi:hypothetical protein
MIFKLELGVTDLGSELDAKICGSEVPATSSAHMLPLYTRVTTSEPRFVAPRCVNSEPRVLRADLLGPNMSLSFRGFKYEFFSKQRLKSKKNYASPLSEPIARQKRRPKVYTMWAEACLCCCFGFVTGTSYRSGLFFFRTQNPGFQAAQHNCTKYEVCFFFLSFDFDEMTIIELSGRALACSIPFQK